MKGNITREEAKKRIRLAMEDIWSDYLEYNPDGISLSLYMNRSSGELRFTANNQFWGEMDGEPAGNDHDTPINFCITIEGVE